MRANARTGVEVLGNMSDSPTQIEDGASTDPARQLRDATRRLMLAHGALNDGQRPCGTPLPTPHAWALLELLQSGPMTVTLLASRLGIDRTNVSRLCSRMESLGELERAPHPEDKRARLVRLTESGAQVGQAVDRSSGAHFQRVLERLPPNSASIIDALTALTRAMVATSSATPQTSSESHE